MSDGSDFDDLLDDDSDILALGLKIAAMYDAESGALKYVYDVFFPFESLAISQVIGILEYIKLQMITDGVEPS